MAKFFVITPLHETYPGNFWGDPEPPEYGRDVVEVEAPNKAKARTLGLKELRRIRSKWIQDQESDRRCPFNGLTIESAEEE